jgi:hypothetical protein
VQQDRNLIGGRVALNVTATERRRTTVVIHQHDIAGLSDDEIRAMVVRLRDAAGGQPPSARRFTDRLAAALVRALNERRRLLAVAELELLNDDEAEGGLVGAGEDPVADALAELGAAPKGRAE